MKTDHTKARSVHSGSLILVNAGHPYRDTGTAGFLTPVNEACRGVFLERRAAALLDRLMGEIHGWRDIVPVSGWRDIVPVSGWRSMDEQQAIWDRSMAVSGAGFTKKYVAVPGCSEHQTGLAVDLGLRREDIDFIRPDFPYEGICQTFRDKAPQYGFIQRYPKGKARLTGIAHEPWHFRYVGVPHAEITTDLGLVLEEYHDFLKQFPWGGAPLVHRKGRLTFEISYLPADRAGELPPEAEGFTLISGDNSGGFILTSWKSGGAPA